MVYHPNIDLEGNVCLNILREDWKPVLTINSIIYGLQYLYETLETGVWEACRGLWGPIGVYGPVGPLRASNGGHMRGRGGGLVGGLLGTCMEGVSVGPVLGGLWGPRGLVGAVWGYHAGPRGHNESERPK
uniref:UBC core domain-containing protein n=1 Tax=Coturnix japonica TaxID=93934 RepID=A0A8C2T3U5_COTJA